MRLPQARVGAYVRALVAGLEALAPNRDWPPHAELSAHFRALDPVLSGELLAPAELDPRTGMPAFPWVERVSAEAVVAGERPELREDHELQRIAALDADLARRIRWRRDLHRHLRHHDVLPPSRAQARARRLQSRTEIVIDVDRVLPDGRWVRIGLVLAGPTGRTDLGAAKVGNQGRIDLDEGVLHLIMRHSSVPLLALRAQVAAITEGWVPRVTRATVGPFWFPGIALPEGVPGEVGQGLCLHLAHEVVGDEVRQGSERDPMHQPDGLEPPEGHRVSRLRRFAASGGVQSALRGWCERAGMQPEIVTLA